MEKCFETLISLKKVGDLHFKSLVKPYLADVSNGETKRVHVYGGHAICQSAWSACLTVPEGYQLHNTHGYFLLPTPHVEGIDYHVTKIRDGSGYITRSVVMSYNDKTIFTCLCSFKKLPTKKNTDLLNHQPKVEKLDVNPDTLPCCPYAEAPILDLIVRTDMSIDVRRAKSTWDENTPIPNRERNYFSKSQIFISPSNYNVHICCLLYMSDRNLLFTSTISQNDYEGLRWVGRTASLTHSVVIHQIPDTNDWIRFVSSSPWTGDGRGLIEAKMWNKNDELLASVYQEAMIEVLPPIKSKI
ncbi:acyl-CoA thioesterase [Acrasis kona]|uniref:Acyl-CoA thioesterase n=1 Tax=Acrasis kona TaxID=1008807 RepID=A0AAW2YLF7_9EUKA